MVTKPTPPPSIEALRDELAMKHYRENEAADRDDHFNRIAPRFSGFCVGWDAALRHLAEAAGGEFDEDAALAAWNQLTDIDAPTSNEFIAGAKWQHARSWARIQELEAENKRLQDIINQWDGMGK